MNKFLMAGAMIVSAMAQPALAATTPKPTIAYTAGSYALPKWTTATVFETFQAANANKAYVPVTTSVGKEVVTGSVDVDKGTYFGADAAASNVYLSLTKGNSYGINFTQPMQYLSFSVHSLNSTDKVTLNFANSTSVTYFGSQIVGSPFTDASGFIGTSGRVNFDLGGQSGIASAIFSSASECDPFLIDNLAAAAPEPGTWALMILGFGMVGFGLRRAHRRSEDRFDTKIRRIAAGA